MSLQRACYFCGRPVSIRRHMSLFCSERCEQRHRFVSGAPPRHEHSSEPRDESRTAAAPPTPPQGPPAGAAGAAPTGTPRPRLRP